VELHSSLIDTVVVGAIDNKDERVGTAVIVVPQAPDLVLPPDIPDCHVNLLVLNVLHVKSDSGKGMNAFFQLG
jgi:hypothetical protein